MRKTLLFAGMAALLASCANQETVDIAPSNTIDFTTHVGKSTRADVTSSTLQKFYVHGGHDNTLVFNGMAVNKTNQGWMPDEAKYWVEGKTYTFAAVAPEQTNATFDMETLTVADYTPGDDDLVAAISAPMVAKVTNNDAVQLNFQHALTKVQVSFVSKGNNNITFSVSDVKLKNVVNKGTLTATYGEGTTLEWSDMSEKGSYEYELTENKGVKYLLPQTIGADLVLSFTISAEGIEENTVTKDFSIPVKTDNVGEWVMGHAYNYSINLLSAFGLDQIEFEVVDAPEWTDINLGISDKNDNKPMLLTKPVKIDFGPVSEEVPDDEDPSWNSITEVNPSNVKLNDSEWNATSLVLTASGFDSSYAGTKAEPESPIKAAGIVWPRLVWKNSFDILKDPKNGNSATGTITISGFKPEQKVNITVLAARWNGGIDARITKFDLISSDSEPQSAEINQGFGQGWSNSPTSSDWLGFDFSTLTHTFSNVSPKADGTIELKVTGIDTGTRADAHISAMVITPVAE